MRLRCHRRVVTVCNNDLCPFKNELTGPFLHRLSFVLPSLHSSPCSHSSVFKLWRCCIRYTVILNEQRERHSVLFFSFSVADSISLWSLMKCTAHLCLWKIRSVCKRVHKCACSCVCVCVCVCVCTTWVPFKSVSNQSGISKKKSGKKKSHVIEPLCVNFYLNAIKATLSVFTCRFMILSS